MPMCKDSDANTRSTSGCNGFDSDECMASDGDAVQIEASSDDVQEWRFDVEEIEASESGEPQHICCTAAASVSTSHTNLLTPRVLRMLLVDIY